MDIGTFLPHSTSTVFPLILIQYKPHCCNPQAGPERHAVQLLLPLEGNRRDDQHQVLLSALRPPPRSQGEQWTPWLFLNFNICLGEGARGSEL